MLLAIYLWRHYYWKNDVILQFLATAYEINALYGIEILYINHFWK